MKLTDREKRMLDGEFGRPVQMAMEMLVALGEIYGAEKMVPVKSCHVAGLSYKSHGDAGLEWVEDLAKTGAKVRVPTTLNVIGVDRTRDLGLPTDWSSKQLRIENAYERLGCYGTSTCTPYYLGFIPHFGEHVSWAESSAVVFVNSVLGARDNREGGPSALAAALTGVTPHYGLHLDENRRGDYLVRVSVELNGVHEYGALGSYVGRIVGDKIPVFEGIKSPTIEELVYLGAASASSGAVAMFHVVGVTPEAPSVEAAFGGKRYEVIEFGPREMKRAIELLTSGKDRKVDYVAIGCPHCSLRQVREVAELLEGKKVHPDVVLWVHTSAAIRGIAKQLGYVDIIEKAGGIVTQDLCTILGCPEALGFKTLATNSPKMAFYAPGSNQMNAWYGSVEQCIRAAITGQWEG